MYIGKASQAILIELVVCWLKLLDASEFAINFTAVAVFAFLRFYRANS